MSSVQQVMKVYHSLREYGIVFIQPQCKMELGLVQRMVRNYTDIVRSIYVASDQIAIVCFQTDDTLLQQTVKERYRVGIHSTLYNPINPSISYEVGYNTAVSQCQDEVLQDMAYATIHKKSLDKLVHIDYFYVNPDWKCNVETRLDELPSTAELDELAKLL